MNRLDALFRSLRKERRCGLIAYVTCGDPDRQATVEIVRELDRAGVDAIELGVPFSDPIADGPVIQAASQRAIERGTSINDLFTIATDIRKSSSIPLIAFSYLNPILRIGAEVFATRCAEAGIDAALVTDLPPESSQILSEELRQRNLGLIFLLAPTSSEARMKIVDRASTPFVYYVSTTGVTGARRALDPTLIENVAALRKRLKKPLAVGFGVSEHAHYQALAPFCDAVIVGSAIVRAIADGDRDGAAQRASAVARKIVGRMEVAG